MTKPAFWIWLLATPVLSGVFIIVLLMMPSLGQALGRWIIGAVVLSALIAVPFSRMAGKAIT